MVRGRCWLGLYHHPPESTSLSCDEWLPEYKFCKVGAGSSSRCGLTRSWANLTSQWAWLTHMLGNQLCKNTPPHCKLNCVKWCRTGQGFRGGSKWGEVGLSSAGKCRFVWGVEVARPCGKLLCWSVCQEARISSTQRSANSTQEHLKSLLFCRSAMDIKGCVSLLYKCSNIQL